MVFKINSKDADDLAGEFDTTPPPAKPEEVGRRKKQTPVLDVFGWLLSNKGSHQDRVVNDFAQGMLQQLNELRSFTWVQQETFTTLDQACYRAMVYQDIYTNPPIKALVQAAHELNRQPDIRAVADCMLPYTLQQLYNSYIYADQIRIRKLFPNLNDPHYVTNLQAQFYPFFTYLYEFRDVLLALAANPILVDSGEEEVIFRPGPVRPYQDVKNDIANQLSGLPPFTARVKIGANAPQNPGKKCLNCGQQCGSGALYCGGCGVKLPMFLIVTDVATLPKMLTKFPYQRTKNC